MNILVLGAGRVGSAMVQDLLNDEKFSITVADINPENLNKLSCPTIEIDLCDKKSIANLVKNYDLVLNAVPGFMGYRVFKTVIESGTDIVDIAFFPEDPFQLEGFARKKNVIAVMDCGVAPGLSNLLIGSTKQKLEKMTAVSIYVGGLPLFRDWPYEYRAVFSPIDVIEEYTRPARYRVNGELIVKDALTDRELLTFPHIGTLEAFNTDGLRTLLHTIDCPNMVEKTLRYPGHIDKMLLLRESGFFNRERIDVNGIKVKPLDLTVKLLFPMWELKKGEEDITVMRIIIEGKNGSKKIKYNYNLFDRYDSSTHTTSMARTTGYSATMVIRLIASGLYKEVGISPPERIGQSEDCVQFILNGLKERGIVIDQEIQES